MGDSHQIYFPDDYSVSENQQTYSQNFNTSSPNKQDLSRKKPKFAKSILNDSPFRFESSFLLENQISDENINEIVFCNNLPFPLSNENKIKSISDFDSDFENKPQKVKKDIFKTKSKHISQTKIKIKGCFCQTTKCLRRYCKCFNKKGLCNEDCGCTNCFNTNEYAEVRQIVIDKTEQIIKNGFSNKIILTLKGEKINSEGCKCRSGCKSLLCACFKNGAGCSPICRCSQCRNSFVEMESSEVKTFFRSPLRTKEKIVINFSKKNIFSNEKDFKSTLQKEGKITFISIKKSDSDSMTISNGPICHQQK